MLDINPRLMIGAICLAALGTVGAAHDSDAEFGERVRAYLRENPETILESMAILTQQEQQAALSQAIGAFPELFSEPAALGFGGVSAPVRVVEFFDYRCAPCKAMHPALMSLVENTPELRVEMRQLPILSPASERGARFALAIKNIAGNKAYGRVHDQLWKLRGPLNAAGFRPIAESEGLDWQIVEAAMESEEVSARIEQNRDIAIALEILGTPAFITPHSVSFGQSDIAELAKVWLNQ